MQAVGCIGRSVPSKLSNSSYGLPRPQWQCQLLPMQSLEDVESCWQPQLVIQKWESGIKCRAECRVRQGSRGTKQFVGFGRAQSNVCHNIVRPRDMNCRETPRVMTV
jgi:hypothetical protein